ncbi:MAG TPA: 2-hydroxyacid dehydrogenase [Nocardioidaceae bacterium]|nr:2-hydroxyacid dehydrogenase [Nocardioidaceae bacterium]
MANDEPLVWLPFDPAELGEAPAGLRYEVVRPTPEQLPTSAADVEFYVLPYDVGPGSGTVLQRMPRLRVVQTLTAGVDHVRSDIPDGVLLCNGRGIHNASTAELALTLTLASLRGIPGFVDDQHRSRWNHGERLALADRTVLIVGYGDIGRDVERRLLPFEVEVLRVARTARDGVHALADLPELLPRADVVILIIPSTSETQGLVDARFLGWMKPGALLVNVARGTVVVTDDLVAALEAGHVRAALDVTDPEPLPAGHPLWTAPNLLVTPHVGGATPAMWPRAYRLVREQLERFAAGHPVENVMTGEY